MTDSVNSPEIPRYRQILRRELPDHLFQPDNRNLLWFVPHSLIIGLGLWLLTAHFTWWAAPLLSLVIGHSFACLAFLGHETCHGGALKNKRLRWFLTGVAFSPLAIGPTLWNRWHNAEHHGNTQHKELDPDRLFTLDEFKFNPTLRWLYNMSPLARNLVIFGFFSLMMTQHNVTVLLMYLRDPKTKPQERAAMIAEFLIPKALWIGISLALGWQVFLFGYFVPLLVVNTIVISYIATNHFLNPLADHSDVLASSLSVTLPRWLGWLDVLHLHFGAHVAHHVFPQAPTRHARYLEEEIAERWPDRFHSMPFHKALKLLWDTPWVYTSDGQDLIDPKVGEILPTLGRGLKPKERANAVPRRGRASKTSRRSPRRRPASSGPRYKG
ncbi:MAG TPA: fatty acid desaturase [Fimbriimonas sp.]|nr:fatty acid desaturase [Fimbriimonas sp.]